GQLSGVVLYIAPSAAFGTHYIGRSHIRIAGAFAGRVAGITPNHAPPAGRRIRDIQNRANDRDVALGDVQDTQIQRVIVDHGVPCSTPQAVGSSGFYPRPLLRDHGGGSHASVKSPRRPPSGSGCTRWSLESRSRQ